MSALRAALALLALVLAGLAALLAADVRSWQGALEQGDARYLVSPKRADWTPSLHLGGAAGWLLAGEDDLRLRHGLQLYRASFGSEVRADRAVGLDATRAMARQALDASAVGASPAAAAQAWTLTGTLYLTSLANGVSRAQLASALDAFRRALHADPSYLPAKYDLELLLRLVAGQGIGLKPLQGGGLGRPGGPHPPTLRSAGRGY